MSLMADILGIISFIILILGLYAGRKKLEKMQESILALKTIELRAHASTLTSYDHRLAALSSRPRLDHVVFRDISIGLRQVISEIESNEEFLNALDSVPSDNRHARVSVETHVGHLLTSINTIEGLFSGREYLDWDDGTRAQFSELRDKFSQLSDHVKFASSKAVVGTLERKAS